MKHPVWYGVIWGMLAAACVAVPRVLAENAVLDMRAELVAGHNRIEALVRECQSPVMQQTNNVTVPEAPEIEIEAAKERERLRHELVKDIAAKMMEGKTYAVQ